MKITLNGEDYITADEAAELSGFSESEIVTLGNLGMFDDIHIKGSERRYYYSLSCVLHVFSNISNMLVRESTVKSMLKISYDIDNLRSVNSDFPEPACYEWLGSGKSPLWKMGDIAEWRRKHFKL